MMFDAAERVADAVLYEGYALYPYRPASTKNRMRWQFGVVAPRAPHEDGEPWFSQTECVIDCGAGAPPSGVRVMIRVRFLRPMPARTGTVRDIAAPAAAAPPAIDWLEGAPHAIDLDPIVIGGGALSKTTALDVPGVQGRVLIDARRVDRFAVLRVRIENGEPWRDDFSASRDAMLCHSLVGAHLLLGVEHAAFVSLVEPPPAVGALAAACDNVNTWPVLVGDRARRNLLLSSPIVLYDFPAVAEESPGDLFDATEIDEILSLRIMTLTDEEKQEARDADPRTRAIVDRVDAMAPETLAALHGTMRSADFFNPPDTLPPDEAFVMVSGERVTRGSRVVLRPNRRADAMDIFLRDQPATVAGVYRDVDDRVFVAVTVDVDPAAAMHESFGRFFYFDPDEVEPASLQQEQP